MPWKITEAGRDALARLPLSEPQRRTLRAIRDYGNPTYGCTGRSMHGGLTAVIPVILRNKWAEDEAMNMAAAKKKETSGDRKQNAMAQVIKVFDEVVDPNNLSRQEYIEFTGELIADLQIRLETAVQEDNEE